MSKTRQSRQKKKTGTLVRIVFWLSLVLLIARLVWVLPAALNHHRTKQAETPSAGQTEPETSPTKLAPNS